MNQKILLINTGRIGDVISSMVVSASLTYNGNVVDFLTNDPILSLFSSEPNINGIREDQAASQYDLLIDLTSSKASRKLVRKIKAHRKIGFHKSLLHKIRMKLTYSQTVNQSTSNHIVKRYYPMLHLLGAPIEPSPKLHPAPPAGNTAEILEKMKKEHAVIAGFHVGAGHRMRTLPALLISRIISFFEQKNIPLILLDNDQDTIASLQAEFSGYPVSGNFNLDELKTIIANLNIFIGPDSGLLHMAAALDIPSIGIYGPNIPALAGPLSANIFFAETDRPCRPCNQNRRCPYNRKCVTELSFSRIADEIDRIFSNYS